MVVGVALPFAFAGEDAGDDLEARLIVVGEVDLAKVPAGQASLREGRIVLCDRLRRFLARAAGV
jgi:hypothetical protein